MTTPITCLIATVKDEAPWLLEWIAHHRVVGFDRIVVASNDCTDGTDHMLDRFAELGIVTHLRNPAPWEHGLAQLSAYARARELPQVQTADWIMPLDSDEFLNVHVGDGTVAALIASLPPDTEAIPIFWRVFGDAGRRDLPSAPIVPKLTRCASAQTNPFSVKVLFRNHQRFPIVCSHAPHVLGDAGTPVPFTVCVRLTDGRLMEDDLLTRPGVNNQLNTMPSELGTWEGAQINHYMVRTEMAFRLKRLRGNALNTFHDAERYLPRTYRKFNRNDASDISIRRTATARERVRLELMADPELHRLHTNALSSARARAKTLEPIIKRPGLRKRLRQVLSKAFRV